MKFIKFKKKKIKVEKRLVAFLKEKQLLKQFLKNADISYSSSTAFSRIMTAFDWEFTEEGGLFWDNIDYEFDSYVEVSTNATKSQTPRALDKKPEPVIEETQVVAEFSVPNKSTTFRDELVIAALQGLLAGNWITHSEIQNGTLTSTAIKIADELTSKLNPRGKYDN
jgi:hypothetical protein